MKAIVLLLTALVLAGCTLTVSPDGSRTYSTDGQQFIKAIQIIAEK